MIKIKIMIMNYEDVRKGVRYRSYNWLVSDSDSYRVCDNIILYPAPLVLPGASRFDQLLALTERLTLAVGFMVSTTTPKITHLSPKLALSAQPSAFAFVVMHAGTIMIMTTSY